MPDLTPEHRQQVVAQIDALTKSIVNKIAHRPISALRRNAGQPDGDQFVEAVRKVFHLQD
jgi:glutamyl-tRNA reductase